MKPKRDGKALRYLPIEAYARIRAQRFMRQLLEATDPFFQGEDWKMSSEEREDIERVWSKIGEALGRAKGPVAIGYKPTD